MPKARLNVEQYNCKATKNEDKKLQDVNKKYGHGKWNKSQTIRFLVQVALDALKDAKVETKEVVKVNGKEVEIE